MTPHFPLIPDKHYFTIGEVSEWCGVEQHVLRYWEESFPQLRPTRRANRRYYTCEDLAVIRTIYTLLRGQKYTLEGARKKMLEASDKDADSVFDTQLVREVRRDLESILDIIK